MGAQLEVEMYFDFSSPYAYFASERIEGLCGRLGVGLRWRPILLGPIFKRTGAKPLLNDGVRGAYARMDCARWARLHDLPYREPESFPVNSLKAARGALVLAESERLGDYIHGCFRAYWRHGEDLFKDDTLAEVVSGLGVDADAFLAGIQSPAVKQRLMDETERAWQLGVFGAPTFIVAGERLWGNDRLPLLETIVRQHRKHHEPQPDPQHADGQPAAGTAASTIA